MRIACVGGGPGGLFFSTLAARAMPDAEVVLFERNQAGDAFGFGVVFSDRTLAEIDAADPVLRDALARDGRHWDTIAVRSHGEQHTFAGNGMAAIHRRVLLRLLQQGAAGAGVALRFGTNIGNLNELADFDVIIGADGANSLVREQLTGLDTTVEAARAKFIWFGTTYPFDGLTFVHRRDRHGNFAVHAYPISAGLSTFIVETDADTWRAAGLDSFDVAAPPGPSDERSQRYLQELFAVDIANEALVGNNSRWANFRTRRTRRWHHRNVVLLGDAVHTAHFSVGSGTKMAMEDAIVLARELAASPHDLSRAFTRYEAARQPAVALIQDSARPSLSWWEHFGRYHQSFAPQQFAFHFFSRSIDIERIRRRDPDLAQRVSASWHATHGAEPLFTPLTVGAWRLAGRDLCIEAVNGAKALVDSAGVGVPLESIAHLLQAPEREEDVSDVPIATGNELLIIAGGTALTRTLLSERARLVLGRITALVEDLDDAAATTLILAGRADAVVRNRKS